jgi:LuxR family maltose regulon positive regulatory protein
MADNLLTTKLFAPALDSNKLVERSALNRHLDNGAMGKLTLVSAPAGFGKSTLVSGWLTSRQHDTAWLSLDTGDNEPGIFWQYVLAALQTVEPDIGHDASQILSSPQLANPHPALVSLLNEISARQLTFTLVLDDYHIIESPVIHDSLSFFLEHMPSTGHMLLLTRVDPPLPLGRLRANSDLSEIRAADLQFTIGETSEFLNKVMDLELSQEQITTLDKRTEGWVVGLKLAGLSLQRRPDTDRFIDAFSGSHQYILEYLTEEVLSTLSDSQQRFLLHTSILDAFCTSLCEAVTGEPDSQEIIDEAISTNLFVIPLDQSGEWFRYHHLFSELLRSLLARDFTNEVPGLHLRASSWYREAGYLAQAADHVFLSGDMERAKTYVIENWNAMLHRGGVNTVLKWVNRLPDHMAQDDVYLALANCWARHLSGRTLEMAPYVEYAGSAFKRLVDQEQLVGEQRGFVESQVYMMRSALLRSQEQFEDSVRYAEQAVEAVPTNIGIAAGPAWNLLGAAREGAGDIDGGIAAYQKGMGIAYSAENYLSAFAAVFWSTMYLIRQGRLTEAYDTCRLVIERATQDDLAGFPAFGLLYVALALIALERNQLDEARELVLRGGGFSEALRYGRTIRARLHLALGEPETAIAMLEDVERIVTATGEPHAIAEMHFEWAKLHINWVTQMR